MNNAETDKTDLNKLVPRGGERPLENIEPLDPRQTQCITNGYPLVKQLILQLLQELSRFV